MRRQSFRSWTDIHSTGFYHMKAKNIISCCKDLVEKHGGTVPRELSELTALAGVGRKDGQRDPGQCI